MYRLRYYHKIYIDNAMISNKNTKKSELSKDDELLKSQEEECYKFMKQAINNLKGRNMDSISDSIYI